MLAAWVVDGECGVGLDVVWETRKDDRGDGTVFFGRSGRDSEDIVARWLMQETKKRDWDKMARWMDAGCKEKDSRVDVRYYPATPPGTNKSNKSTTQQQFHPNAEGGTGPFHW
jgi:hypothetical protein